MRAAVVGLLTVFFFAASCHSGQAPTESVDISTPLRIDNFSVATGKPYEIREQEYAATDAVLDQHVYVYIDRNWELRTIPDYLQGLTYVKTAMEDRNLLEDPFMSFELSGPARVYVTQTDRVRPHPAWLAEFTETMDCVLTEKDSSDCHRVHYKDFPAGGVVTLGPNVVEPNVAVFMYNVLVGPIPDGPIAGRQVELGQEVDLDFITGRSLEQPWESVGFWGTFVHEETSTEVVVQGSYAGTNVNGNPIFRLTFRPGVAGYWTYTTQSSAPSVTGITGSVLALEP